LGNSLNNDAKVQRACAKSQHSKQLFPIKTIFDIALSTIFLTLRLI